MGKMIGCMTEFAVRMMDYARQTFVVSIRPIDDEWPIKSIRRD